ncbi:hypothetical protein [Jannaschia sp. 2305UL9-9]|uniref:hypothetical protein n=1 Tax=Jannaschia sp. 2305UL9-9 TaxID=3121638 RepID=UPI0035289D95
MEKRVKEPFDLPKPLGFAQEYQLFRFQPCLIRILENGVHEDGTPLRPWGLRKKIMYELMKNAFRRFEDDDMEEVLYAANEARFFPPLSDEEMQEVLDTIGDGTFFNMVDCDGYIGLYCNRALCETKPVGLGKWPRDEWYD